MNTQERLSRIWASDYMNALPSIIQERGSLFYDNEEKEILITGFNPSFREGEIKGSTQCSISNIWNNPNYDTYWSRIKKLLQNEEINLMSRADYLDIFYFREKGQDFFKKEILTKKEGILFAAEQLNTTMHILEEIVKPKLIVAKNKESWAYWGKLYQEKGWVWMGYAFEHIENLKCGELCRITGLIDSPERIAPEIRTTNLNGTYVLFTKHLNQFTPVIDYPSPQLLTAILKWYDGEKEVRENFKTND